MKQYIILLVVASICAMSALGMNKSKKTTYEKTYKAYELGFAYYYGGALLGKDYVKAEKLFGRVAQERHAQCELLRIGAQLQLGIIAYESRLLDKAIEYFKAVIQQPIAAETKGAVVYIRIVNDARKRIAQIQTEQYAQFLVENGAAVFAGSEEKKS